MSLSALVGVDFSLIGTKLHAAYEKDGDKGYSVLLMPTPQETDNGVSIGSVIKDIRKLAEGVNPKTDTADMENDMEKELESYHSGTDSFSLDNIIVKLNMAYLYIHNTENEAENVLEYAFQLEIISEGFFPEEIRNLVDVTHLSISIWQTDRKKVLDQMNLITINEYLGLPDKS